MKSLIFIVIVEAVTPRTKLDAGISPTIFKKPLLTDELEAGVSWQLTGKSAATLTTR
jgi:hypothetical protein